MSEPSAAGVGLAYSYRPSLLGAQWQFKLTDDYLEWSTGRRSGRTPYRDVRRVRMSFRPVSMQSQRYQTEVWAEGAPKLAIVSSSWKSMFEQERLDKPYSTFVTELHRRLVRAAAPVRYEQGTQPLKYWPALVVFVGVALGLCALIVRGLQTDVGGRGVYRWFPDPRPVARRQFLISQPAGSLSPRRAADSAAAERLTRHRRHRGDSMSTRGPVHQPTVARPRMANNASPAERDPEQRLWDMRFKL